MKQKQQLWDSLSSIVIEEVDNVVQNFYYSNYYQDLNLPEMRQKLIQYTLTKFQKFYRLDSLWCNRQFSKYPYHSLELRLRLEKCIYEGISNLLGLQSYPKLISKKDLTIWEDLNGSQETREMAQI